MNIEERIHSQLSRQLEMRNSLDSMQASIETERTQQLAIFPNPHKIIGVILAACLAIALIIVPWGESTDFVQIDIERPTLSDFRSASPSDKAIEDAISAEEYVTAIDLIDIAVETSSKNIADIGMQEIDEELLYEIEFETAYIYQLRWMRIYALVCLEKYNEAICDLEPFVTQEGEHQEEAKALRNKLKSKK